MLENCKKQKTSDNGNYLITITNKWSTPVWINTYEKAIPGQCYELKSGEEVVVVIDAKIFDSQWTQPELNKNKDILSMIATWENWNIFINF